MSLLERPHAGGCRGHTLAAQAVWGCRSTLLPQPCPQALDRAVRLSRVPVLPPCPPMPTQQWAHAGWVQCLRVEVCSHAEACVC